MQHLISRKLMGFGAAPLHRAKEPHPFHYLAQRTSFWVAVLSLFAFVTGNMIGQHGWQVFWKSVLGRDDDSLIVYTGTVTPIASVPDYSRWLRYGGNAQNHTYREVPQDLLIPLPPYLPTKSGSDPQGIYSVDYMGSYTSGGENSGSHPAVDIRVPVGTPVRAIANGVVSEVKEASGFGNVIVLRHPNVPDPTNPKVTTTLYSSYAHLSAMLVEVGDVMNKGDQIGLSGATGDVSGPHLHFQIDRADAPWHPYWPFSTDELRAAGISSTQAINSGFHSERGVEYTVNPLLYVQADYAPATTTIVQNDESGKPQKMETVAVADQKVTWLSRVQSRIERMRATRLARQKTVTTIVAARSTAPSVDQSSASFADALPPPIVQQREVVVSSTDTPAFSPATPVVSVDIWHDGIYTGRGWERMRLTLLDAQGNVVTSPILDRDIVLRTAFGSADFQPETLSVLDFQNGKAEVGILPHGRRTVVVQVMPFNVLSQPMRYEKE